MEDWSIEGLNAAIAAGRRSCAEIVGGALARATDPDGEGSRVFRGLRREAALVQARAQGLLRSVGLTASPLAGLLVSIKDNIDFAGERTRGGCKLLEGVSPATQHAPVVRRLHAAGAIVVGRTNMSELAFSGVGYNRFYGTPANPFDRDTRRIPGGSSSGAAISVTDGMAVAALGTDTGGSVRVPAALTGLVGFKPTQARVPAEGVLPLSTVLDCIGPLARNVADCAQIDGILADDPTPLVPLKGCLRLCTADDVMLRDADDVVLAAYLDAKETLLSSGAQIDPLPSGIFAEMAEYSHRGTFSNAESWERFGSLVEGRPHDIDPRIAERILRGRSMTATDWLANLRARETMMSRFESAMTSYDALIAPTTPIIAPPIADMKDDGRYRRANGLILRNPMIANLLDAPSLSLPCHLPGAAPVGLMLIGPRMADRGLLNIGAGIEPLLRR
ncbi:MAG: amidase [Alphaproteobacteria bacterium]|nr:amidase [Alphaproteobacteria bacterium]